MGACEYFCVAELNLSRIIKEIGRGKNAAGDLSREDAEALFGAILAGRVSELELGAILIALRVKGESLDELAGFAAACEASYPHLDPVRGERNEVESNHERIPVVIPSYNEAENIAALVAAIRDVVPDATIVVVDDSPDLATVDALEPLRAPWLRVIHRDAKGGRGTAALLGMAQLLAAGCDAIVEMDADFSHAPAQIPELVAALAGADMVVASRYVRGGRIVNWPLSRRLFSRVANMVERVLLRVPIHDYTGGYRAYSRRAAELIGETCGKIGRGFIPLSEIAVNVHYQGLQVVEVPTTFVNRTRGQSSFSVAEIFDAARGLMRIYALKRRLTAPAPTPRRTSRG